MEHLDVTGLPTMTEDYCECITADGLGLLHDE
jgi:hypothetical protein